MDFGVGCGSTGYEYGNFGIEFDPRDVRFQEELDIFGASMSLGSVELFRVMRSMDTFAKQVIPAFRQAPFRAGCRLQRNGCFLAFMLEG